MSLIPLTSLSFKLCCNCVCIDSFDDFANSHPNTQICKHFYDTAIISEWPIFQNRKIFHETIINDVFQ